MPQLHVATSGIGPDLILLHGWAMHSGVWDEVVEALAARWRVTCVDLPGHGRSADGAGLDALAEVVPDTAVWVGWSLGGLWAIRFAERFPHRVQALGLVASSPSFVCREGWAAALPMDQLEGFAAGLEAAREHTLRRFVALQFMGVCGGKAQIAALQQRVNACPPTPEGLRGGLAALRDWDLRAAFARLPMPVVGVFGALDRLVPAAAGLAMRTLNPCFDFTLVQGAGHAPFLSHRQSVVAALESHFGA